MVTTELVLVAPVGVNKKKRPILTFLHGLRYVSVRVAGSAPERSSVVVMASLP
jgi:hypothetical protein